MGPLLGLYNNNYYLIFFWSLLFFLRWEMAKDEDPYIIQCFLLLTLTYVHT